MQTDLQVHIHLSHTMSYAAKTKSHLLFFQRLTNLFLWLQLLLKTTNKKPQLLSKRSQVCQSFSYCKAAQSRDFCVKRMINVRNVWTSGSELHLWGRPPCCLTPLCSKKRFRRWHSAPSCRPSSSLHRLRFSSSSSNAWSLSLSFSANGASWSRCIAVLWLWCNHTASSLYQTTLQICKCFFCHSPVWSCDQSKFHLSQICTLFILVCWTEGFVLQLPFSLLKESFSHTFYPLISGDSDWA